MTNLAFMTADGFPPGRTDACETPLASQANRGQCEQGRECGGDRHGSMLVAVTVPNTSSRR